MSKKILIPLAQGFEEAEFIGIADICRRVNEVGGKLESVIASLDSQLLVKGANGITIQADTSLDKIQLNSFDAIALAGGLDGMKNLNSNANIIQAIKQFHKEGKLVAAMCASPIVLNTAGVIQGDFTCYPGCESGINGTRKDQAVVINGNVITSAGPSTGMIFGLEIVRYLCGQDIYQALYNGTLMPLVKKYL